MSLRALMSQACTRSRLASSINQAALAENQILERGAHIPEPFYFCAGLDQNVHRHIYAAETTMRALRPTNGRFVAVTHDHKQVKVAALVRLSPGVRAKQPHLLWFELRRETAGHFVEQVFTQ